jgi:hypothetical protein
MHWGNPVVILDQHGADPKCFELVEYEDEWHINDGSPIPQDADTLEKDGSVVAYRKVKEPEVLPFGELTREEQAELLVHFYVDRGKVEYFSTVTSTWRLAKPPLWQKKCKYRKAK